MKSASFGSGFIQDVQAAALVEKNVESASWRSFRSQEAPFSMPVFHAEFIRDVRYSYIAGRLAEIRSLHRSRGFAPPDLSMRQSLLMYRRDLEESRSVVSALSVMVVSPGSFLNNPKIVGDDVGQATELFTRDATLERSIAGENASFQETTIKCGCDAVEESCSVHSSILDQTSIEVQYSTSIDSSGTGKCNSTHRELINDAVDYINEHLYSGAFPTTCTRNTSTDECSGHTSLTCFSGFAPTNNPRNLADYTLNDDSVDFVIHCNTWFLTPCVRSGSIGGYTVCGQWNDSQKDIHLCRTALDLAARETDDDDRNRALGRVIVHEIYHVWGADEAAAYAMEPEW